MPLKMPDNENITISKRELPGDYRMPQMEMARTHYSLGFVISGDRCSITPKQKFTYHAGDVSLMPPLVYHRTIPQSDAPYINYLVKISMECKERFCSFVDRNIWESLFEQKVCSFSLKEREKLEEMFEDMLTEYEKDTPYREVILEGMLFRLLTYIFEHKKGGGALNFGNELSPEILEVLSKIEESYASDLTMEDMALEAGFSTAYFSRLFKAQLGLPFSKYLTNVRIRHVEELLSQTDKSISEIALETGFSNGDYLCSRFKQRVGLSPTEYRKKSR
ncbi:MAG: AraC family transcriptional regulator [Lachnospiraceae bacterium]|nr:AraC family transcriptional regulator [Lachnospiraceae bacterium]